MKAVILDAATLGDDIDLEPIRREVDSLEVHATTLLEQRQSRLAGAEVALVNKVVLDAELLAQVYVELKGGRQIGLELAAEAAMAEIAGEQTIVAVRKAPTGPRREPRPHFASQAELARHREFMAGIENPLWG